MMGVCGGLLLWRWKLRPVGVPLLWLILALVGFNFVSTSLSTYRPLIPSVIYSYPVVLPAVLLVAATVAWGIRGIRNARTRYGPVASVAAWSLLALFAAYAAGALSLNRRECGKHEGLCEMAGHIRPGATVMTDYRTRFTLSYCLTGVPEASERILRFEDADGQRQPEYLLLRPAMVENLCKRYGYEMPACACADEGWEPVCSGGGCQLFRRRPPLAEAGGGE